MGDGGGISAGYLACVILAGSRIAEGMGAGLNMHVDLADAGGTPGVTRRGLNGVRLMVPNWAVCLGMAMRHA